MKEQELFSIGQVSKLCAVTPRMLRHYEKMGLIQPDKIADTGYRYYSIETMNLVQTIRYLIDDGFSLDEIKESLHYEIDSYRDLFIKKIEETEKELEYCKQRLTSLKNWCSLLIEVRETLRHPAFAPAIKYIPEDRYFFYERECLTDDIPAFASIETEYFTKSKQDGHNMIDVGGAFTYHYDSIDERIHDKYTKQRLIQVLFENSTRLEDTFDFGGFNAACVYHIGGLHDIYATYDKLLKWISENKFNLRGDAIERHVLDVYSTCQTANYVTEIILPLEEDTTFVELAESWK
ncbi:MAG: MerR family transcriptional regulator [Clostridiales bacterium]|nr:MerR family transcriptional regulator [Clostridiales bacterium]